MKSTSIILLLLLLIGYSCHEKKEIYVCPPCDLLCDTITFTEGGICPHCKMKLIKQSELIDEAALKVNEVNIKTGSGVFLIEGGQNKKEKNIKVYYHQPKNYRENSKVLIVLPGAGRNGDSYRDAWIEAAEKYSILVLSPMYAEQDYSFEEYHLGGLIQAANVRESIQFIEGTNIAKLDEAIFSFTINNNPSDWLFNDLDRLFNLVTSQIATTQTQYDIFGHSAGGQILHRFPIFYPNSKAKRIIAANAGFYTLPNLEDKLPFGIKNTPINPEDLELSFAKKLTILIGELDNEQERGGTLLRSLSADKQGLSRLARGQFFYQYSQQLATKIDAHYNWTIKIVPNVGHDHKEMGKAAAKLLYE